MGESEALTPPARAAGKGAHRHRKKRLWVLHPVLFAAVPVLALWSGNIQEGIPLGDVLLPLSIVVGAAVVVFAVASVALKSGARAGLVTSLLVGSFFTYGLVAPALDGVKLGGLDIGQNAVLLPAWALLTLGLVMLVARTRRVLPEITTILNVVAAGLVILNVWSVVSYQLDARASEERAARLADAGFVGAMPNPAHVRAAFGGELRDIYYLVFEEYAGEQVMADLFHHDNGPFLRSLEDRGFFVPHRSTANYPRTNFSLASSMNMQYLGELTEEFGAESDNAAPLTGLIQYNRIGKFLQSVGYTYYQIGSWWGPTARSPIAENLKFGGPSEFAKTLAQTTVLKEISDNSFRTREYNRVRFQFAAVPKTQELEGPRFVFAHFLIPHGPYVFNPDGSYVSKEEAASRSVVENYANQVRYANGEILKMVDALLDRPEDQQPIIIVQADEGPFEGQPTTWIPRPSDDLKRKFPILNAYFLPGHGDGGLKQDATPVNTFRTVLNLYFGADLEMLPDRNFVFRSLNRLYQFTDVTDLVRDTLSD